MDRFCSSLNIDEKGPMERAGLEDMREGFLKLLRISNRISAVHEKVYSGRSNPPAHGTSLHILCQIALTQAIFQGSVCTERQANISPEKQSGLFLLTLKVVDFKPSVFPV